jgi:hypothetical protein
MRGTAKLPFLLLRVYPRWWRERYGDEMEVMVQGLVEGGRPPLLLAINLLASSVGVWLRGTGAPGTREFWSTRTQRSLLISVIPWFVFIPLNVVFALSNSQHSYVHGSSTIRISGAGSDALHFQSIVVLAAFVSCLVALVGWQILRGGLGGQSVRLKWFRLTNRFAMAGIALAVAALFLGEYHSTSMIAEVIAVVGGGLVVVSWVSLPGVLVLMMRDGRLTAERLRAEVTVSTILAGLNVLATLCVAAYLFAISRQPVPLPGASYWYYRSTLGDWNVALLAGFAVMALLSVTGTFTARHSYARTRAL